MKHKIKVVKIIGSDPLRKKMREITRNIIYKKQDKKINLIYISNKKRRQENKITITRSWHHRKFYKTKIDFIENKKNNFELALLNHIC